MNTSETLGGQKTIKNLVEDEKMQSSARLHRQSYLRFRFALT